MADPARFESYMRVNNQRKYCWQRRRPDVVYGFPNAECAEEFQKYGIEAALLRGARVQSLRYPKWKWSEYEALRHCLKAGGEFEPALVM
jgi:hypothetical protein